MKKKGMKRALVLALTLALAGGGAFTSYADYVANNLEMLRELIEEERELVEVTLPAELEELETVTIPALEKELEELQEAHEKDLEENPHSIDTWLEVQVKSKESELNERKRDIDRIKEKIKSETYSLSELEKRLEQETKSAYDPAYGTDYASDELRATNFAIANKDGNWVLYGEYRSWNSLMGGSWFYNKGVTEDLEIGFYIDGECVESSLSRAESYDTETDYAWAVPFHLEYSTVYKIEINNIKFNVSTVGNTGLRSSKGTSTGTGNTDNKEDTSTEQETTEETTNTATTDYPGYYDATLADSIPNQSYYAQATDGGWVVSLGGNFEEYSEYDKSNQRGNSDLVKGWLFKDGKWYAFDSIGHQVVGWMSVGGYWYCVYPGTTALESCMLTGWQEINDGWYYFNTSGQMVANCVVDGYSIGADGIWRQ